VVKALGGIFPTEDRITPEAVERMISKAFRAAYRGRWGNSARISVVPPPQDAVDTRPTTCPESSSDGSGLNRHPKTKGSGPGKHQGAPHWYLRHKNQQCKWPCCDSSAAIEAVAADSTPRTGCPNKVPNLGV